MEADPNLPTSPTSEPPGLSDPYTFCNCGKSGCPEIRSDPAGGVVISAPREEMVDRTTMRPGIELTAEDASKLRRWLEERGF